jgi:hypothetical protein
MTEMETRCGIRSTWFFLPRDRKHIDSYYSLRDKKIRNLISFLRSRGDEIALHGTVRSHNSSEAMTSIKNIFNEVTGESEPGIRQHRLMWKHPDTALVQESAGFAYDSTLGFAGHEGFRNGYCFPFRLFDFANNRMMRIWEIPMVIMDSTLFDYRMLSYSEAGSVIGSITGEIKKFGGVFTLLWHNSYLHEYMMPGINQFYEESLINIMKNMPESLTGMEIIKRMNRPDNGKGPDL